MKFVYVVMVAVAVLGVIRWAELNLNFNDQYPQDDDEE